MIEEREVLIFQTAINTPDFQEILGLLNRECRIVRITVENSDPQKMVIEIAFELKGGEKIVEIK